MEQHTEVESSIRDVLAWHTRPGAIDRLLPPWQPLTVEREADSLRSGTAVLRLAGGIRWRARHDPAGFVEGRRFVDRLDNPILSRLVPWCHIHEFEPVSTNRTRVTDRVVTRVPDRFLAQMLAYRGRQLAGDMAAHARSASLGASPMTVAVTGSNGLIGRALCALLSTGGHRVVRLVRSPPHDLAGRAMEDRWWDPLSPSPRLLDGVDAVIHLAGSPVAGRFNDAHKSAVRDSRIEPTRRLAQLVGTRPFVVASAVGIYGPDRGDEVLTERSGRGDGFLADLVADWEAAAEPAWDSGARVVHVRTGIVQSPRGGAQRLLYSVGLGGRLGSGRQWVPWIGIDDIIDIYLRCLVDDSLCGALNAVAPDPVRNAEYTKVLAAVLRRPAVIPVPPVALRVALGNEATREFLLAGQRAVPAALDDRGHRFRFPTLEAALRHVLGRVSATSTSAERVAADR